MIESYATEAATFLIGIATGIVIRAKLWWKNKTSVTMSRRVILNTTISKKSKSVINLASTAGCDGKTSAEVDYICQMYAENKDFLEDPEAVHVARAYISERNKRLLKPK
ncbi:MAG: hypothetical protein Q8J68_08855 [Methanolobus sp.]|uniref:hypothetical protein n=1 Tax=Methanolobus sp. TaxID=1874737 RepID=UPI00273088E6|nr:hypothetical protein [Methanolobus sp.]MDP2217381.1 hypothetical protein [Methanolobus sp.]